MSSDGGYDSDELRALAIALDVLDPADPDQWDGDPAEFEVSVSRGRERLERRGIATFARDGSAEVDPAAAPMLRAFLAPDAVIEAWAVDGDGAAQREWYLGPEVTVVADPVAPQELTAVDTREVFTDVFAFLDLRGSDVAGEPVLIQADALDDFTGRLGAPPERHDCPPRLLNVAAAWERHPRPRELQIMDAGDGGLWIVTAAGCDWENDDEAAQAMADTLQLTPTTRAELIDRLLATLAPGAPL